MLTQQRIFWFWLPLAASMALMMTQGPIIQAAIARLPEANTMLAASGIVISLAVTIESPVIMLLATSTALAGSAQAYRLLRRYVLYLNIVLTITAATIAFVDPVYNWLVPGLMGIPAHIAAAAQPGLQIMTLWTAAIGWRRFYQGLLIRFDQTRRVGYGTVVRIVSAGATALALVVFSSLPGVIVAACTWMAGVLCELAYAYLASRPVVAAHLSGPDLAGQPALTYKETIKYHLPLAATSLLTLLAQPMIGAALARMLHPEENLAAWPIIFSVWLFFRSFGMALPEVIVAQLKNPADFLQLRRFCRQVAVSSSAGLALMGFSPLITFYLLSVTGITPELAEFVITGVAAGLLLPALQAVESWQRGVLMVVKATGDIYWGMGVNLLATAVTLAAGVVWQMPGAPAAAVALSVGMLAEILYLWWRLRPVVQARFQFAPRPVATL